MSETDEEKELTDLRARAEAIGYVVVQPFERIIHHGEGADEEYELVPTSRQTVYENVIAGLKERLKR